MAVFAVVGKLGTGKTKFCVWRAQQALLDGRRVASNVDLRLAQLVPGRQKASYVRVPDKPTADDLAAIGHGNPDSYDEERNGVLILDELGSWLNARGFQDKGRHAVIDWLIHARKHGWDVYLIVQDTQMIDKQVREALVEYEARCIRLDKVKIPFFGSLLGMFNRRLAYMPRMHMVAARLMVDGRPTIVAERWTYRGDDLHAAYDTRQIFKFDPDQHSVAVLHEWYFARDVVSRVPWWRGWFRVERPVPVARQAVPPSRYLEFLRSLPPEERIERFRRFQSLGFV